MNIQCEHCVYRGLWQRVWLSDGCLETSKTGGHETLCAAVRPFVYVHFSYIYRFGWSYFAHSCLNACVE